MLEPDLEERLRDVDCAFCRSWWHYSHDHKDVDLQCTPVYSRAGTLQVWPEGHSPECHKCLKPLAWTDANREMFSRVSEFNCANANLDVLRGWGWSEDIWQSPAFRTAIVLLQAEKCKLQEEMHKKETLDLLTIAMLGRRSHG